MCLVLEYLYPMGETGPVKIDGQDCLGEMSVRRTLNDSADHFV